MHVSYRSLLAMGVAGVGVAAIGRSTPARAAAANDQQPSIVEDYSYPGADQVLATRGVKLIKGDGHIMLADCGADPNHAAADLIIAQSLAHGPDGNYINACFRTTGASGYLSMELSQVYVIRGNNRSTVKATVSLASNPSTTETDQVDPGEWQGVGVGANKPDATLLELRFPYAS